MAKDVKKWKRQREEYAEARADKKPIAAPGEGRKKKECPICSRSYFGHDTEPVCDDWDCRIAKIRCKNWNVPLYRFHDETRARDTAQSEINLSQGFAAIHLPEVLIISTE